MKATSGKPETEGSARRRSFPPVDRRRQERQSSIVSLCAEHPRLSAFVENQIVLGRSSGEIGREIAVRFGLKVSNAAVTAYRHRLAWTGMRAVEQIVEESREEIGRLIDEMESDGGGFAGTIAGLWQGVRRWLAGTGNREQGVGNS